MRTKQMLFTILFAVVATVTALSLTGFQVKPFTLQGRRLIVDDSGRIGGPTIVNGTLTVSGVITASGGVTEGAASYATPTTLASATTLTIPTTSSIFTLTGTANCTRIVPGTAGRIVYLWHTTTDTLTDGGNLKLAGNFNGTADDLLTLVQIDTFWYEISRSAN